MISKFNEAFSFNNRWLLKKKNIDCCKATDKIHRMSDEKIHMHYKYYVMTDSSFIKDHAVYMNNNYICPTFFVLPLSQP